MKPDTMFDHVRGKGQGSKSLPDFAAAPTKHATQAIPGSREKLAILVARARNGEELFDTARDKNCFRPHVAGGSSRAGLVVHIEDPES